MTERVDVGVMARLRRYEPPKVSVIVGQIQGKIIGYERAGEFVPLGSPCCDDPLECRRCFEPVAPWWVRWRR